MVTAGAFVYICITKQYETERSENILCHFNGQGLNTSVEDDIHVLRS